MQGMLLAAGLGTRLRPLTDDTPKPAVLVADKPLGWFALSHLAKSGVTHVVANTHYLSDQMRRALEEHRPPGLTLAFSHEPVLLGTGGGIRKAEALFAERTGPVVVMNSDTIFAPDLAKAVAAHDRHEAIATMVLRHTDDPERWGSIEIDEAGRVHRILGKPDTTERALRKLMFAGVHILSRDAFQDLPEQGCIIRHANRKWVDEGAMVIGVVDDSPWSDVGSVEAYERINRDFASGKLTWPGL